MRALAVLCVLCVLCGTAAAEARLDLRVGGVQLHARVRGSHLAAPVELYGAGQPAITATSVRGFADAGPVGIAFVVQADELSFGLYHLEEEWEPEVDLFTPYVEAFDRLGLAATLPSGSQALLVTYNTGATIRAPWQPASTFTGAALGTPADYKGTIGTDLVAGLELALREIDSRPFGRKIVFVLGDGNDTSNEVAKTVFVQLARERRDVMFVALRVRSPISAEGHLLGLLTPHHRLANPHGIEAAMKSMLEEATQQFDATFDVTKLERDGLEHRYTLVAGNEDVASASVTIPKRPPPPPPATLWRWFIILGAGSALGLVALVMVRWKGPR